MRDKYAKRDIKFKHNSMNIITYRARHNELVVLLELAPQGGGGVDQSSPWVRGHVVPPVPAPQTRR
jgi:hypothetical protein